MNTLECPDSETLHDFLLGRLEEATVDQFEAHLADCEDCRTACGSLAAGDELTLALHGRELQNQLDLRLPDQIADLIPRLQHLDVRFTEDASEPDGIDVRILLSAAVEPDEIGRFAGYRVLKYLGQGGMGIVFAAEDPQLRRQVALKILNPVLAASRIACRRFERETQAAAGFEHDHIITIYHVGEEGGLPFMAMQLLDGESLQDRLDREGTLAAAETLRIGKEIADGLAAAHLRGLLHRDIKPDNIWLQSEGDRVKILDFGLARLAGSESRLTEFGSVIGTPDYMAPEQAMGTEVDERCDLFSLGSLLYRCITGETPFRRDTAVATLVAVNEHAVAAASEVSDCPPGLSDFIGRLMQKQAADRPESAVLVSTQLGELSAGNAVLLPSRSKQPPRYRTWLVASVAAAAAFLLAIVIQVTTNKGTLTVETSGDEFATTVQGETLLIREVSTGNEIKVTVGENSVAPGEYEFQVQNLPDGIAFSTPRFSIFRGGEKQVELTFKPKTVANVSDAKPESNGPQAEPGMASANKEAVLTAETEDSIVVIKKPLPKLPANAPMNPEALVTSPVKLPGVQSWTIEPADESMPLSPPVLSKDGKWLAAYGQRGSVRVWETDSLNKPRILYNQTGNVGAMEWSPDGQYLATSSRSTADSEQSAGNIVIYATDDFRIAYEIKAESWRIRWSPSGTQLAFLNRLGKKQTESELCIFDTVTETVSKTTVECFVWANLEWSSDSQLLAVASSETVKIFEADPLRLRSTLDVDARDFRWNAETRELFVQSVPKGLGEISVGADNGKSVSLFRFEKWNIMNETVISTQDETLIGRKSVHWDNKGQPSIIDWPESVDLSKAEDSTESPPETSRIELREVFEGRTIALPALPVNNEASRGFLQFSDNGRQIACPTATGLYLRDSSGQNDDWQWVADVFERQDVLDSAGYDKDILHFTWSERSSFSVPMFTGRLMKAALDVESLNLKVEDATWPIGRYEAVDPTGRFVAECKTHWTENILSQVLDITDTSNPDASPQEFLLDAPSKRSGRYVPKWSGDGQFLAAVVEKDGAALQMFGLDESGETFAAAAAQIVIRNSEETLTWSPEGHIYAREIYPGPAILDAKTGQVIDRLPLDSELRLPNEKYEFGPRGISPSVRHLLWLDSQTLFGSVSGTAPNNVQTSVCYLWKKTADGSWSVAQKFKGHSIDAACVSPDQNQLAFGRELSRSSTREQFRIADLNTGLVRTIDAKSLGIPENEKWSVMGWVDQQHLWIRTASKFGVLSLLDGQINIFPKSGSFTLVSGGFCRITPSELRFYDREFRLSSSIVISSNNQAAAVFPDGQLKVNVDNPCSMLCVTLLDDGTQVTLTSDEFKKQFGQNLPEQFFEGARSQHSK